MDGAMSKLTLLESEAAAAPPTTLTLVLLGRTGSGKSATGNSILGRPAFESKTSSAAVTRTCQLESATLPDGRVIRVVDTPPGFVQGSGSMSRQEDIETDEIVKCLDLAADGGGVHAFVLVLSTRNPRTAEEVTAVVESLEDLFGDQVLQQYVVVVFTNGDALEDDGSTLEEYCSGEALTRLLDGCGNRAVLFNNRAEREDAKARQVAQLLRTVADMVRGNGGKPYYTNEMFRDAQVAAAYESELQRLEDELTLVKIAVVGERAKVFAQACTEYEGSIKEAHRKFEEQHMDFTQAQFAEIIRKSNQFGESMMAFRQAMEEARNSKKQCGSLGKCKGPAEVGPADPAAPSCSRASSGESDGTEAEPYA